MTTAAALSETGWTMECDICHVKKTFPQRSQEVVLRAAQAEGWREDLLYGEANNFVHTCPVCARKWEIVIQ